MKSFFDPLAPERKWSEFWAEGYDCPISGSVFDGDNPTCCGMPLGGLGTGCIDLGVDGTWGYNSIFNGSMGKSKDSIFNLAAGFLPRTLPSLWPIFGINLNGTTHVLTTKSVINGGKLKYCTNPGGQTAAQQAHNYSVKECLPISNVQSAEKILYFGHYPICDMEFKLSLPVSIGIRAFSPLIPGDEKTSNIPAACFIVRVRNDSETMQRAVLAFNFPGFMGNDSPSLFFTRENFDENGQHGVRVAAQDGQAEYAISSNLNVECGAGLNNSDTCWSHIDSGLPRPEFIESRGVYTTTTSDASISAKFSIKPHEEKNLTFMLTWYAPVITGETHLCIPHFAVPEQEQIDVEPCAPSRYTYYHMYATRFSNCREITRYLSRHYQTILKRIINWQSAIYQADIPIFLKDQLINSLHLIAEDSYWVQARSPIGDFAFPGGLLGLNESPRECPHMNCIPCDWYGNFPFIYFFPSLYLSCLRAFKYYQRKDGCIPFELGRIGLPDFATPTYYWQRALNSTCYIMLVDRMWQYLQDDKILDEFYESLKAANDYTISLNTEYGGIISMPTDGPNCEWFELGEWDGMCTHMGGLRLLQLQIMKRMAHHLSDNDYAQKCEILYNEGKSCLENDLWDSRGFYKNFYNKATQHISDDVMAYQTIAQWACNLHGINGVFNKQRAKTVLDTVKNINIPLAETCGAINFARPERSVLDQNSNTVIYGSSAAFVAEFIMLSMLYILEGETEFGVNLLEKFLNNLILKQGHAWDLPCIIDCQTGQRRMGTEYYQYLMLWAVPLVIEKSNLSTANHGLIGSILEKAAAEKTE